MIDLSDEGVYVDPAARTARVQPGVNWGQLNRETQLHGLAVTGGLISTTGIAGLTLGGGLGWLMPKFGLATDNVLSARVVTADGRTLTASEQENAISSGGCAARAPTSASSRPSSTACTRSDHRRRRAGRASVRRRRGRAPLLPGLHGGRSGRAHDVRRGGARAGRFRGEDRTRRGLPRGRARAGGGGSAAAREFGSPIMVELGPLPYTVMNSLLDAAYPTGSLNYWKSAFLRG